MLEVIEFVRYFRLTLQDYLALSWRRLRISFHSHLDRLAFILAIY